MAAFLPMLGALATLCVSVSAMPLHRMINGTTSAMLYFTKFGYMEPELFNPLSGALPSEDTIRNTILEFQVFSGLNQTGELDNETLTVMNMPRCGGKDKVSFGANTRRKRHIFSRSSSIERTFTYKITKYPDVWPLRDDVDKDIAAAFRVWEDVTYLTFEPDSGDVDIEIRFERGWHRDGTPFDGPGGDLAHPYSLRYHDEVHFDDSELWNLNYKGVVGPSLLQVAAHEFGHSLGLNHAHVSSSVMSPFYPSYGPDFDLNEDDIEGIKRLYAKEPDYSCSWWEFWCWLG